MAWSARLTFRGIDTHASEGVPIFEALAEALVLDNEAYLRHHPDTPPLYAAGVFYREEQLGVENWNPIEAVLEAGHGDCEDLACWLCAEYRVQGIPAVVRATPQPDARNDGTLWHFWVEVQEPTSDRYTREDPSSRLGMKPL